MSTAPDDDLYAVLGLTPGASSQDITRAYRARLRENHPDTRDRVGGEPGPPERFQQVLAAYAVLRDPARRGAYDRRRGGLRNSSPDPQVLPDAQTTPPATGTPPAAAVPRPRTAAGRRSPIRAGPVRWQPR